MGQFGTCAAGCSEQRLELVPAAAHESGVAMGSAARARAEAFRLIAEKLATADPATTGFESAYRSIQHDARNALRRHPDPGSAGIDLEQPAEAVITWWCPECGGLDALQDCLGICVWRRVEWVRRSMYEDERKRAAHRMRERTAPTRTDAPHRLRHPLCRALAAWLARDPGRRTATSWPHRHSFSQWP
jgi:hypothetical protein